MSRETTQALESLIPLYSAPLPRELIDLAESLLAQSRNKVSNLKADENIARTYICANIACERLKRTLNLPKIQPKPPIAPRSYKKLYDYFDRTLAVRTREAAGVSTPSKQGKNTPNTNGYSTPKKNIATNDTPTKPPPRASAVRKRGLLVESGEKSIPKWIRPLINALCIHFKKPEAASHILAGITTILTVPSPSSLEAHNARKSGPRIQDKKDKVPALIVALFILVATELDGTNDSIPRRKEVIKGLNHAKEEMMNREANWEREKYEDIEIKDVAIWIDEISEKRWKDLDWFLNIEGAEAFRDEQEEHLDKRVKRGTENSSLRVGLGTMFQDRIDYLSEEKRREYRVWKEGVLRQIEQIEAEDGEDE